MATDDFSLINDAPPPHQEVHSVASGEGVDYYPHPAYAADGAESETPTTPSSKRHLHHHSKRQRQNGEFESNHSGAGDYYRKDREEWSDTAIACLLEAYTEKYRELNRGNLRGRDWEEVAETVSERSGGGGPGGSRKSVEQCKNKIDNLKKRYKVEMQRISSGGVGGSSWHWFKHIEGIMGNSRSSNGKGCGGESDGGGGKKGCGGESDGGGGNSGNSAVKQVKRYNTTGNPTLGSNSKPQTVQVQGLKWRRVVFKISGTALAGNCQTIDPKVVMQISREVATAYRLGLQIAIVVGGRNFFCGDSWVSATGLERHTAYQIGMTATVMNAVLLKSALEKLGVQTRVQSSISIPELAEPYSRQRAIRHLEKGRVVLFGGVGAGNPLFTTDTAAALRASEISADALLKGTNTSGIILDHISFKDAVSRGVTSMDMMAITFCEDNGIPVVVFNLFEPGNISRALCGDQVGTSIDQTGGIA